MGSFFIPGMPLSSRHETTQGTAAFAYLFPVLDWGSEERLQDTAGGMHAIRKSNKIIYYLLYTYSFFC